MRIIASWLVLGVATLSAATLAATPATRPAEGSPGRRPASPPVFQLDVPAGSSATDFLHRLQQADPDFQYIAQPGPWEKAPLPEIQLRGVTPAQGVALLQNLVDVQVDGAGAGPHPVYIFRGRNVGSGPLTSLSAFGLADPVERLGVKETLAGLTKDQDQPTAAQIAAAHKQALKEVLSLLESAADQADPPFQPSLKLHEETEVLLVRGTTAQLNAVSQALKALQSAVSSNDYVVEAQYRRMAERYRFAKDQLDRVEGLYKTQSEQNSELRKQNAALKSQLKETSEKNVGGDKH